MCTILLQTFDNQAGISLQGKRALRNAEADAKTANVDLMRVLNNQSTSDITLQSTLMRLNRTEAIVQRLQNRHARYRFRLLTEIAHQTGYVVVRGKDNRIELR